MNGEAYGEGRVRRIGWRWRPDSETGRTVECQAILDSIGDGVYQVDLDGRIVYANAACEALLGWRADELVGRHAHELFHRHGARSPSPEDGLGECPLHPLCGPELLRSTDDAFRRSDGSEMPVDCTSTPVRRGGEVIGRVCVFADITPVKEVERELAARAEHQAAVASLGRRALSEGATGELMEEAVEIVAETLDVEFAKVLEHREERGDLLLRAGVGWPEGLVGTATVSDDLDSQAGYTLEVNDPVVVDDLLTERRFHGPTLLAEHGVRSGISAVIDGADGAFGVLGAHSARKRAFAPHEVAFLQSVANDLGAAISRNRAEHLQVLLERGRRLQALGELAGGVAHDFNNLLGVIRNYADLAVESETPEALAQDLGEIRAATGRGAELTRQLLAFSHQERTESEVVDVRDVIEDAAALLRRTIGKNVIFVAERADAPMLAKIDSAELHRSLVNLALNARDAMPGGGELRISAERVELRRANSNGAGAIPAGHYVRIAVADTGEGMTDDVRAKAFDPFFTTKGDEGTGLGLATVYGVVARASGHVSLRSTPGKGTEVALYLPVSDDDD